MTPDEWSYDIYTRDFKAGGRASIREWCAVFCGHPEPNYPPPTRWLWTVLTRWCGFLVPGLMLQVLAAYPFGFHPWTALVISAPLLCSVERRKLQDATVASVTVIACGLAFRGHPIAAALTCAAMLCIKEGGILMLPAVFAAALVNGQNIAAQWPIFLAPVIWLAVSRAVCGPSFLPALTLSVRSQRHAYTREHQSGMPHRLIADLALVSPFVLLLAPLADWRITAVAAAIVATHMLSPVRNVRTILAADLLLRISVGMWLVRFGWWGALGATALVAWDVWLIGRLRGLRDTVTAALVQATGCAP